MSGSRCVKQGQILDKEQHSSRVCNRMLAASARLVLNKDETPFAPLFYDRYEAHQKDRVIQRARIFMAAPNRILSLSLGTQTIGLAEFRTGQNGGLVLTSYETRELLADPRRMRRGSRRPS